LFSLLTRRGRIVQRAEGVVTKNFSLELTMTSHTPHGKNERRGTIRSGVARGGDGKWGGKAEDSPPKGTQSYILKKREVYNERLGGGGGFYGLPRKRGMIRGGRDGVSCLKSDSLDLRIVPVAACRGGRRTRWRQRQRTRERDQGVSRLLLHEEADR